MRSKADAPLLLLLMTAIAACGDSAVILQSSDGGDSDAKVASDAASGDGSASSDSGSPLSEAAAGDGAADALADTGADSGCQPGSMPDGDGGCTPITIRRPFLVGSSFRAAAAVSRGDWLADLDGRAPALPAKTMEKLAKTWLKDALEEHASVAAFARFTMHLLALGAPPDLAMAAQRASIDEIHHAKMCFALAHRYGSKVQGPGALSLRDALDDASLVTVAALAAEEGCVGETLGAALAREQATMAKDPAAKKALEKIARDEARHAELSWRFVRWAVLQGGDEVRRAVEARVEAAIASTLAMEIQSYDGIDLEAWHAHGRLTCSESRAVAELAIRDVVRPCLAAALRSAGEATRAGSAGRAPGEKMIG